MIIPIIESLSNNTGEGCECLLKNGLLNLKNITENCQAKSTQEMYY